MPRAHDDWDDNAPATHNGGNAPNQHHGHRTSRQQGGDNASHQHGVNRTTHQNGVNHPSRKHGNRASPQNGIDTSHHGGGHHRNGVSHQTGGNASNQPLNGDAPLEEGGRRHRRGCRHRRVSRRDDDNDNDDDRYEALAAGGGRRDYDSDRRTGRDGGHDRRNTRSRSPARHNPVKHEDRHDHDGSNGHFGPQYNSPAPQSNNAAPQSNNAAPQSNNAAPQSNNAAPQSNNAAPQSNNPAPKTTFGMACYDNEHRHHITAIFLERMFFEYWRSNPVRASEIIEEELPANTRVSYGHLWYPNEDPNRRLDDNDFFPCIGRRQIPGVNGYYYDHLIGPTTREFLFRRFLRVNPRRAADLLSVISPNRTPLNHHQSTSGQQPAVGGNVARPLATSNIQTDRYEPEIVQCVREDERRRALQIGGGSVAGEDKIGTGLAGQNGHNAA
ncbi:uncharacterized protein LOC62_01G001502 [Vanrija pseudolonga]|uniref:Uncharacterized protein n=1 Tax=Vanrija pseudolonga TaxID=143232 RepID=A0AAF0Y4J3_9TREE|nr:hypothetical protein LOC62_01G001502 [Vanrija pseudolonga]